MAAAKSVTITARIPAALAKKLEAYAKAARRTRSWVVEDILDRYVDKEMAIVEAVLEGIEAADRGEIVPHDEVFRKLREKSAARRRAMAKKVA
jgi:RHH-type rel operon transcriptional repressor/antitoxin RelB